MNKFCHACVGVFLLESAVWAAAASPAGWRLNGSGVYPDTKPVTSWSQSANIVWSVALPDWGNASPIIVDDKLFVCAEPGVLLCLNAADGSILWRGTNTYDGLIPPEDRAIVAQCERLQKKVEEIAGRLKKEPYNAALYKELSEASGAIATNDQNKAGLELVKKYGAPKRHDTNGFSSPTPCTDGTRVYVLTGWGTAACYELDGTRVWLRLVERPSHEWGHSASPVLVDGKLVVHIGKAVIALDPATGRELWRAESKSTFGTPVVVKVGDAYAVYTTGADLILVADGRKIGSGPEGLPYGSPLADAKLIYSVDENGGFALRVPAQAPAAAAPLEAAWKNKPAKERYYGSGVVHDGLLYVVTAKGVMSAIDVADGTIAYEQKLDVGGTAYPSICLAGGNLFVSGDPGVTVVVAPGREYKELARNKLEGFRSTPLFVGDRIYVRGLKKLYCIGEK